MLGAVQATINNLEPVIQNVAARYGIDPALIKAHIKQESNWKIDATRYEPHLNDSSWGLMQVLLKTAQEISGNPSLTSSELMNPVKNIEIGTAYIAKQLQRYYGDLKSAIAAYNAGTAFIKKGTNNFVNQEYVDSVMRNYNMYKTIGVAFTPWDLIPTMDNPTPLFVYAAMGAAAMVVLSSK